MIFILFYRLKFDIWNNLDMERINQVIAWKQSLFFSTRRFSCWMCIRVQ